jgi:aminoglycoside/choline kinase family phosphotransferase
MNHSEDDRERLLDLWEDISEDRPAVTTLRDCAIQRLMQALGAYGNLVENQQQEWYQQHIPTAVRMLQDLVKETSLEELLAPYLRQALRQK